MHNRNRTFLAVVVAACILAMGFVSPAVAAGTASVGAVDERSAFVVYNGTEPFVEASEASGGWVNFDQVDSTDGHIKYASFTGSTVKLTFIGRTITWVGWKRPTSGKAEVRIDNGPITTVDNYSAFDQISVPVFSKEVGTGQHTIEIRVLGTMNPLATDDRVHVDGFIVSDAGTYEDTSSRLEYGPTVSEWVTSDAGSSGGSITTSSESSAATVSLVFRGPSVSWYTLKSQNGGEQEIHIDGVRKWTLNTDLPAGTASEYMILAYTERNLDTGPHRITIKSPAAGRIHHDSFVVGAVTPPPDKIRASYTAKFTTIPTQGHITVSNEDQLRAELLRAGPGTRIRLAAGSTFKGPIQMSADGSAADPIWIFGEPPTATRPAAAVITTDNMNGGGKALELLGANHVRLSSFTVSHSFQGVHVVSSTNVAVANLFVHDIGYEAIHLLYNTTDSYVVGNTIEDTGFAVDAQGIEQNDKGEGVYVGTSPTRWSLVNDGNPDRSGRIVVANNKITRSGANHIEVKAATFDGVIRDNILNSHRGIKPTKAMLQVGGNDYTIINNALANADTWGLATIPFDSRFGNNNSWRNNRGSSFKGPSTALDPAMGYKLTEPRPVFYACDNVFTWVDDPPHPEFRPQNVYCTQ